MTRRADRVGRRYGPVVQPPDRHVPPGHSESE